MTTTRTRRSIGAVAGVLVALGLSACEIRTEEKIVVNEDGSGTIEVVFLADEEFRTQIVELSNGFQFEVEGETTTTLNADTLFDVNSPDFTLPPGFEAENIDEGDFKGFRVRGSFDSPEQLAERLDEAGTAGSDDTSGSMDGTLTGITLVREGDGFRFSADLSGDTVTGLGEGFGETGGGGEDAENLDEAFGDLSEAFKFRLEITMPGHIAESNADFLPADDTAVWTIDFANPNRTLEARSEPGDGEGQSSNPAALESEGNPAAEPIVESDGADDGGSDGAAQSDDGDTGDGGDGDDGSSVGLIIGIVVALLVVGGIVFLVVRNKKKAPGSHGEPGPGTPGGFPAAGPSPYAPRPDAPYQQGGGAVLTAPPGTAPPSQTSPPAWHPDPTHRHQLRYHDGTRWTAHVSDGGVGGSDPI